MDEDFQFPAMVEYERKYDKKVNIKTGKTRMDKAYGKGTLPHSLDLMKVCHCILTDNDFYTLEFDKMTIKGIEVIPGTVIPFMKREEAGQPYVNFSFDEVIDFNIQRGFKFPRFCVNTYNNYVFIFPVSANWIELKRKNKELIIECQKFYESIGIKSNKGPGLRSNYEEPFTTYFENLFNQMERTTNLKKKQNYYTPYCLNHKRSSRYMPQNKRFFCKKCEDYIA